MLNLIKRQKRNCIGIITPKYERKNKILIKVDAQGLEVRAAFELSQDEVGIEEIINGVDIHEENRKRFGLPDRLIAKTFFFRLLYGGSAYAYTVDSDFSHVSRKEAFWQDVIDETYKKYRGLAQWHKDIVKQVQETNRILIPTGREYVFFPTKDKRGELQWPITTIKNYPVQGFGADLVQVARISAWRRLKDRVTFINTVHDDFQIDINMLDITDEECYNICIELEKCFEDVPNNVERIYKYKMKVPMAGEVSFGNTLASMKKFNRTLGKEQFL